MLSKYQLQINEDDNFENKKLLLNLGSRREYYFHYLDLKLYFELRLQSKKIQRVLEFRKSAFLKLCIKRNRQLARQAEKECNKT